ncbi:hypothetical protein GZ77_12925 [Endozoicomonas montiporae]|uniref:Endonuclease/exonuclease/phosphatase domain-containing protein n=2 Tax=Endozoicomonas montiporae TaxID=1027273 RepID=A0A081N4F2_9GAMM|nr:sphingomyelin phosphodiesterase [Endozoicomonas montiporae]AMO57829.1 nSMase domain protein [Endozoicomonas montiporae CL-33]KEQ13325.1 hypothetical protein GZ77_12925 [Endozoicomonas montiporae]
MFAANPKNGSPCSRVYVLRRIFVGNCCHFTDIERKKRKLPLAARKALKAVTTALFIIPSLALAVIGMPFRIAGNAFRSEMSMICSGKPEKQYSPQQGLHLMTYNTGLMPGFIRNLNDLRSSNRRAAEIAEALNSQSSSTQPDVVCFQEVFDRHATEHLCEGLKQSYPYIVHSVAPRETGLNSGLAVASKFPVLDASFRPFKDLAGEDQLANKGLLRLVLDLGEGKTAIVYNTHLQAKEGDKYHKIRTSELAQIRQWMEQDSKEEESQHEGIFLSGDLNISQADEQGKSNAGKEYQEGIDALGSDFHNSFYETHNPQDGKRLPGSAPVFLDLNQPESQHTHTEPTGSWYQGAGASERQDWGTSNWEDSRKVADHCLYDYQFLYGPEKENWASHAEVQQIGTNLKPLQQSGLSDHLPVSVIYKEAAGLKPALMSIRNSQFHTRKIQLLIDLLKDKKHLNPLVQLQQFRSREGSSLSDKEHEELNLLERTLRNAFRLE